MEDDYHLRWASSQGRCLLTHDLTDYPRLAAEWFLSGRDHPGIILCRQAPYVSYGEMRRRRLRLLETLPADEMINRVEWLDDRWSDRSDEH